VCPTWNPFPSVECRRLSGLSARPFQEGFRDEAENEYAFDTLDQVREVVRRAYLGGGIGPAPVEPRRPNPFLIEPEGAPLAPLRDEPSPSGGKHYDEALKKLGTDQALSVDYSSLQFPAKRPVFLQDLFKKAASQFYPYLRAFGEGTVLDFAKAFGHQMHLPEVRERLVWWLRLLLAVGLWENANDYHSLLEQAGIVRLIDHLRWPWLAWDVSHLENMRLDIFFQIPCPLRANWDHLIQTVGHKLFLALVDRYYFETNKDLPQFIPSLFCGLLVVVNPTLSVSGLAQIRPNDRRRLIGRALHWLTAEMPRVELPQKVEQELSRFVWKRLALNSQRQ